jgi:hypothetical protein
MDAASLSGGQARTSSERSAAPRNVTDFVVANYSLNVYRHRIDVFGLEVDMSHSDFCRKAQ